MEEQIEARTARPHSLNLTSRKKLQLTGVVNVDSFNDTAVTLNTSEGVLLISGRELSVAALNVGDGTLTIDGQIDAIRYKSESDKHWVRKLFK